MTSDSPAPTAFTRIAPWVLGLIGTTLALIGSWRASPTDDEPTYVGQGNYILANRDFRTPVLLWQPPLALYVQAAGVACVDARWNDSERAHSVDSVTALGDAVIFESPASPETVLRAARMPIAIATGLLAVLAAILAQRLAGATAMMIAGVLVAMSPAIYGHGGLATTDLVATLGALLAAAGVIAIVRTPPERRGVRGALVGVALLAKHTAIPLVALAVGVTLFVSRRHGRTWRAAAGRASLLVLTTAIVVWAGYGFDVGRLVDPKSSGDLLDKLAGTVPLPRAWIEWIARDLPMPAPRWFQSLVFQSSKAHGRLYFRYFGELAKTGWWTYFPVVTLGKMTLGSVGLCAASMFTLRRRRPGADEWVLFLAFALPFAAAVVSRHNLGVRHVLPALAPLFVLVAVRIARISAAVPRGALFLTSSCMLFLHAGEGFLAQRYPVAWWNLAFGGTRAGWRVGTGSNADWGQGVWALREVVRRERLENVHVIAAAAGETTSALSHIDEPRIDLVPTDWWNHLPTDGWLAVSTSALWPNHRVPVTDAPSDRFVAGCYRLYKLPLAER